MKPLEEGDELLYSVFCPLLYGMFSPESKTIVKILKERLLF